VLDFTSALYLGIEHASRSLPGWDRLTLGKPAALESPPGTSQAEKQLAALSGCERASLASSTLHLFLDLFSVLARHDVNIFLDEGSYPIARWGVERAACLGVKTRTFPQHDAEGLHAALKSADSKPPVIVADGYCPGCGKAAPLTEYLACATERGGLLVIDDTQALGIFGQPAPWAPYGRGGGGSMRRAGLSSGRLVMGSSLAKAFGVPVAVLAGSAFLVEEFERRSACRVHCSPPSVAVIAAAARALQINRHCGDALRFRMAQLVSRLRSGLRRLGLIANAGLFPVQPLRLPEHLDAGELHEALQKRGVQTVLHAGTNDTRARISFVVTARHAFHEIDQAITGLADAMTVAQKCRLKRSI